MADAAAFFASKKKKKKTFKFNANNIDASTIEKKIHVEAPALSTDNDAAMIVSTGVDRSDLNVLDSTDGAEQWDDEALAATLLQKKSVTTTNVELLDMKALDLKLSDQTDIQERLRVEENKAKLAAAREAMEKEAQRLKEEKERKEQDNSGTKSRFGTAAAGLSAASGGSKWLPPHMRGGGTSLASRLGTGGPGSQKLDTEDENLFPDLAAADAILEKQKAQGPAYKVPKKTPVGGGAAWGSKPQSQAKKIEEPPSEADHATQEEEPKTAEPAESAAAAPVSVAETDPVNKSSSTVSTATAAKAPIKPTKKKKKDLSTFKPTS